MARSNAARGAKEDADAPVQRPPRRTASLARGASLAVASGRVQKPPAAAAAATAAAPSPSPSPARPTTKGCKAEPSSLPGTKSVTLTTNKALSSRFRGVCWNKKNRRWQAAINASGKYLYLGSYVSEDEAARAFDRAAIKVRGRKGRLNFPDETYTDADGNLLEDIELPEGAVAAAAAHAANGKGSGRPRKQPTQQQARAGGGSGGASGSGVVPAGRAAVSTPFAAAAGAPPAHHHHQQQHQQQQQLPLFGSLPGYPAAALPMHLQQQQQQFGGPPLTRRRSTGPAAGAAQQQQFFMQQQQQQQQQLQQQAPRPALNPLLFGRGAGGAAAAAGPAPAPAPRAAGGITRRATADLNAMLNTFGMGQPQPQQQQQMMGPPPPPPPPPPPMTTAAAAAALAAGGGGAAPPNPRPVSTAELEAMLPPGSRVDAFLPGPEWGAEEVVAAIYADSSAPAGSAARRAVVWTGVELQAVGGRHANTSAARARVEERMGALAAAHLQAGRGGGGGAAGGGGGGAGRITRSLSGSITRGLLSLTGGSFLGLGPGLGAGAGGGAGAGAGGSGGGGGAATTAAAAAAAVAATLGPPPAAGGRGGITRTRSGANASLSFGSFSGLLAGMRSTALLPGQSMLAPGSGGGLGAAAAGTAAGAGPGGSAIGGLGAMSLGDMLRLTQQQQQQYQQQQQQR